MKRDNQLILWVFFGVMLGLILFPAEALALTRDGVIDNAKPYKDLTWTCSQANIDTAIEHGYFIEWFKAGEPYDGEAYCRGADDTTTEFTRRLTEENRSPGYIHSKWAGSLIPKYGISATNRLPLDDLNNIAWNWDHAWATGIDCSGYVSRAWGLPVKLWTGAFPNYCLTIVWDNLKKGDVLLRPTTPEKIGHKVRGRF